MHAEKAMKFSKNNSRCRCHLQFKKTGTQNNRRLKNFLKVLPWKRKVNSIFYFKKGHVVTLQILFLREISWWWKVGTAFSSLFFWNHSSVYKFHGAIDISFQTRGAESSVIHGLEKPKLLHTGTCTSTSTRRVT